MGKSCIGNDCFRPLPAYRCVSFWIYLAVVFSTIVNSIPTLPSVNTSAGDILSLDPSNRSTHLGIFPLDDRFRCPLEYKTQGAPINLVDFFSTAISLVNRLSHHEQRKIWHEGSWQLPDAGHDVCIRYRSIPQRPGMPVRLGLSTRFIENAMFFMGCQMSRDGTWKPVLANVFWYNEKVGQVIVGHKCPNSDTQSSLLGDAQHDDAVMTAIEPGENMNIATSSNDARVHIKYRYLEETMLPFTVFFLALRGMIQAIESDLDLRCDKFLVAETQATFSMSAHSDRFGNVKLRYADVSRVLYKMSQEMVAKGRYAGMEVMVFRDGELIAQGVMLNHRPEAASQPLAIE